jgi:dynein-related subfamily AAA family protein
MQIEIERLSASDYTAKEGLVYVDAHKLHPLYDKLAFHANMILAGPKGSAKSLSIASYCAEKKYPIITFDCSEDVRRSDLVGMFVPRGDQIPFVLGPVTSAFEIANEVGVCVLLLEEISSLSPAVQKVLNPVTDFRRALAVPTAKRFFRLNSEAKLWFVGTMVSDSIGGDVYALNSDLKSRVRMIPLGYPGKDDERKIVTEVLHKAGVPVNADMLKNVLTLAQESRQGALEYSLSTRDLVHVMEDIHRVGAQQALWILSGKFEGVDRTTILKRVEGLFGLGARLFQEGGG